MLCNAAGLGYLEWKTNAANQVAQITDILLFNAREKEVGDAYLEFKSELQAKYVRDKYAEAGLFADLFPVGGGVGVYLRWSERPTGHENNTGKIGMKVSETWTRSAIPEVVVGNILHRRQQELEQIRLCTNVSADDDE
ncbi:hypothetical protein [Cupriavidus yeoncheonensis]|nr:hypothetical protein [Cupriavidus yeoncheonensis]